MEMLERYVQQVGRSLPGRDREDIQNELRSSLQDKLEDRTAADTTTDDTSAGDASEADVIAVLKEMGSPREVAASYSGARYLVGPELFPLLMQVLRIGLLVYIVVNAVLLVFAAGDMGMLELVEAALDSIGSVLGFFGAAVAVFAILEWQDVKINPLEFEPEWDPQQLPEVDQPGRVNLVELFVGIAFNLIFLSLAFYFWRLGGVPYVVNWFSDATVLPVTRRLLLVSGVIIALQMVMDLIVYLRRRWEITTRLVRTVLDIAGVFAVFAILQEVIVDVSRMSTPFGELIDLAQVWFRGLLILVVAIAAVDGAVKTYKLIPGAWKVGSTIGRES
jgi:HAAS domain-containing protein